MSEFKSFFEVFRRYSPNEEKRALLNRVVDAKYTYQKDPLRVEAELTFASHEDAEAIYEIEDECRALYGAASFKILPHFPPESFSIDKFSEVTAESE